MSPFVNNNIVTLTVLTWPLPGMDWSDILPCGRGTTPKKPPPGSCNPHRSCGTEHRTWHVNGRWSISCLHDHEVNKLWCMEERVITVSFLGAGFSY
jgi:hypothetical protein